MAMKRCPVCGERYSDTYKTCPFCEEDELWEEEEPRRGPKSRRGSAQYSLITPTLIVLILVMAGLLIYLLYGDKIAARLGGGKDDTPDDGGGIVSIEPTPGGNAGTSGDTGTPDGTGGGAEDPDASGTPDGGGDTGASGNAGVMPEGPDNSSGGSSGSSGSTDGGSNSYASLSKLPGGLTLSNPDFTRSVSEGPYRLRVSGGSGTYTWVSENPAIATVGSDGTVTPVASGTVHILVSDGAKKAIGVVRVKGGSAPASSGSSSGSSSSSDSSSGSSSGSSSNKLNRDDMTLSVGESFQLQLSGVTTGLTWSVKDSGIATVSGNGSVTGVSKGTTTVTVSWDGGTKSCIVRVK